MTYTLGMMQTPNRFGRLTVVSAFKSPPPKLGSRPIYMVNCRCDCGETVVARQNAVRSGNTSSCGCLWREVIRDNKLVHGDKPKRGPEPEYRAWINMKTRCTNPKHNRWRFYGGRGIRVCDHWMRDYQAFLADMGRRPSAGHSIDRINNDGNYEPGNCRWATASEQRLNQRRQAA
jgi:hypothetical protein